MTKTILEERYDSKDKRLRKYFRRGLAVGLIASAASIYGMSSAPECSPLCYNAKRVHEIDFSLSELEKRKLYFEKEVDSTNLLERKLEEEKEGIVSSPNFEEAKRQYKQYSDHENSWSQILLPLSGALSISASLLSGVLLFLWTYPSYNQVKSKEGQLKL